MALGVSTVGAVLIGWIVVLGLLLAWLWIRGNRVPRGEGWSSPADFDERRRGGERRMRNLGPPPGVGERRSGFERRRGRGLTVARP
jgi:hypothetical protein